jgi:hypothetical protein
MTAIEAWWRGLHWYLVRRSKLTFLSNRVYTVVQQWFVRVLVSRWELLLPVANDLVFQGDEHLPGKGLSLSLGAVVSSMSRRLRFLPRYEHTSSKNQEFVQGWHTNSLQWLLGKIEAERSLFPNLQLGFLLFEFEIPIWHTYLLSTIFTRHFTLGRTAIGPCSSLNLPASLTF